MTRSDAHSSAVLPLVNALVAVLALLWLAAPSALAQVSFSGASSFAAGDFPESVAVGDFNGDSDPDLAVANFGSGDVSVLLGAAGGGFGAATSFAAGNGPESVAVGDFNGDSDPDLAVANAISDDVSVLLNTRGTPVAADDAYSTNEDAPLTAAAPGRARNDSDPDGDPLTASVLSGPAHGTLTLNADGSFTYTPAANFNGTDSFTYKAGDG